MTVAAILRIAAQAQANTAVLTQSERVCDSAYWGSFEYHGHVFVAQGETVEEVRGHCAAQAIAFEIGFGFGI